MPKLTKAELAKAKEELKEGARERVAERGILQFRADAETVKAVILAAEQMKIPVGTLLRLWIQERLELDSTKGKALNLIDRITILEDKVAKLQKGLKTNRNM